MCILLTISCREDTILVTEEDTILMDSENVKFQFQVTDELGESISNAQIMMNSDVYISDDNGIVLTQPYNINSIGMKSEISAFGFESLIKLVNGPKDGIVKEKVILFKTNNTVIQTGATGVIDGGGALGLPANLITSDGSSYTGEVIVKSKYLNPDDKDFLLSAPGNLLALNTSNEYQQLASLGMYMIELYDPNGVALSIPEGSTSTIEFPIADVNKDAIDSEVPLWYFDGDQGIWIEDGVAKVVGDKMIAEVGHFTWWNCDLPYDFIRMCMIFRDNQGEVIPGMQVGFHVNGSSFGNARMDNNGAISSRVPVNERLDLKFFLDGEQIGSQSIGPYNDDEKKDVINTDLSLIKLLGFARDCDGNIVSDGYGFYLGENGLVSVPFATDGSFIYCVPRNDHELVLIDINSNKAKEVKVSGESINENITLGEIKICDNEVLAKISGRVLIDTDEDTVGDTPLQDAVIGLFDIDYQDYEEYTTDINGYYEIDVNPSEMYRVLFVGWSDFPVIGTGDNSPDGDYFNDEYALGEGHLFAKADLGEHDTDNDFVVIQGGEGTITGTFMGDTDNDGIGDIPLEWAVLKINSVLSDREVLINQDGSFSITEKASHLELSALNGFAYFNFTTVVDLTPDPEGDYGPSWAIPVILYDGEVDADNTFVAERDTEKSALFMVMEDIDMDGIGDVPLEGIPLRIYDRITGEEINGYLTNSTNQDGIKRYLTLDEDVEKITARILSSEYEVVNIIDTSPDNDPFIVDGDVTKMEIDLAEGEWDSGNIFVVRKI